MAFCLAPLNCSVLNIFQGEPLIDFSRLPKNSLWTLVMTSPDEPFLDQSSTQHAEYIHWMMYVVTSFLMLDQVL